MKKIYLFLLVVLGYTAFAQQKGISYQAVIINPNATSAPGYNGTSTPLANKAICLSFQIVNGTNQVEYQESQSISTDGYGMVNVVIGTGISGTGLVSTLEAVAWNQGNKKLVVRVNTEGVCSNFTEISNQVLNYTPYSFYAQNADLKDGYVTTSKLANGAVTDAKIAAGISASKVGLGNVNNTSDADKPVSTATQSAINLKANLASPNFTGTVSGIDKTMVGLTNVDNTSDADKPVSTATQTALNLKENISNKSSDIALDASSTTKYPTVKAVKDYVDANSSSGTGTIVDAETITKGKIKLAGDLGGTADMPTVPGLALKANSTDVTTSLALKANLVSPTFTGTVSGIDKTMVGLNNVDNTSDANKPVSNATQTALALKANATDVTTSLALKENLSNKSSNIVTDGTSTTKYPTVKAIKDYVDAQNAAAGVADGSITSAKIANATIVNEDVAATAAIDFSKLNIQKSDVVGLGLSKADIGLANVDNTIDVDKPVSTATQTALNLKANLASPTFTGTVSGIDKTMVGLTNVDNTTDTDKPVSTATQTALNLKANLASPTFTGTVTAPIYASTPQTLTDAATIDWNPTLGLNASVTLGGNRTLSFASTPALGSYGTLIVTQDATGGRTITLPSTSNKVLGSTSTTTITLSSAANAKDILNFYYDGTNCYWNIGQGYGTAATTNVGSSVSGVLAVANGGSGAATLTGYIKGNGTSAMTASSSIPLADVMGAAPIASPTFTGTPAAPTAPAGTNTTQVATTAFVTTAVAAAGGGSTAHSVGEVYGGGKVFYVTPNGLHGLIAETQSQGNDMWWYANDRVSDPANHSTNGKNFTDWRVPTYPELYLLYLSKSHFGITGGAFWTSTANGAYQPTNNGHFVNMVDGSRQSGTSNNTSSYNLTVWAVRSF